MFDFRKVVKRCTGCFFHFSKLDESFPLDQFLMNGYWVTFYFDKDGNGGGNLLHIRENVTSKLLSLGQNSVDYSEKYICITRQNAAKHKYQIIL